MWQQLDMDKNGAVLALLDLTPHCVFVKYLQVLYLHLDRIQLSSFKLTPRSNVQIWRTFSYSRVVLNRQDKPIFKLWSRSASCSDDLQIWNGKMVQNWVLFQLRSCRDRFHSWNSQFQTKKLPLTADNVLNQETSQKVKPSFTNYQQRFFQQNTTKKGSKMPKISLKWMTIYEVLNLLYVYLCF